MPAKNDRVYLEHILEAIGDIQQYTADGHNGFLSDRMQQDAVIRKLQVIGEAVKNLSDATTAAHPYVPWRRIAGMRDRLTHAYFGVDLALVWVVVDTQLPSLRDAVIRAIAALPTQ